jgi:hypothetical protein
MIAAFVLSVVLAQAAATAPPQPDTPAAAAGWIAQPDGKPGTLFAFVHAENDGTKSAVSGLRQVCDCEPSHMTSLIAQALSAIPHASIIQNSAPVCGLTAQHLVATGIANGIRSNLEVYAFRKDGALYVLEYTFQEKAPDPQAEAFLASHCP